MTQVFLCKSKNNVTVTYDPVDSNAATHLEDTPQLKELVIQVVTNMVLDVDKIKTYVDMGKTVGTCDVVDVDDTDEILYAARKNRMDDGLVPFTTTRPAATCQYVTVVLEKQPNESYELSSAWIGVLDEDDEPFPGSADATEDSISFWSKRAFVWGSQEIIPGTETTAYPW